VLRLLLYVSLSVLHSILVSETTNEILRIKQEETYMLVHEIDAGI